MNKTRVTYRCMICLQSDSVLYGDLTPGEVRFKALRVLTSAIAAIKLCASTVLIGSFWTWGERGMSASRHICPVCESPIHRSHSRSVIERLIRIFTRYKLYKCSTCKWRGWLSRTRLVSNWKKFIPTLIAWALTIILVLLLSFHFIQSSEEARSQDDSSNISP